MLWTDLIMYAVVLLVGVPAAFRSPVALVLCVWWLLGMATWWAFGTVPPAVAVLLDLAAFFLVAWKAASLTDIAVAMLFAPTIYAHAVLPPYEDWLVSLVIGLAQFLLAGWSCRHLKRWGDVDKARRALHRDIDRSLRAAFLAVRYGV